MLNFLFVGIGGFIGATLRYLMSLGINKLVESKVFPFAIMSVNLIGSFLIGYFIALLQHQNSNNESMKSLIVIGLLGSFTTFSTFSLDNFQMIEQGKFINLAINIIFSVTAGILLVWLGYKLGNTSLN